MYRYLTIIITILFSTYCYSNDQIISSYLEIEKNKCVLTYKSNEHEHETFCVIENINITIQKEIEIPKIASLINKINLKYLALLNKDWAIAWNLSSESLKLHTPQKDYIKNVEEIYLKYGNLHFKVPQTINFSQVKYRNETRAKAIVNDDHIWEFIDGEWYYTGQI